MPPWPLTQRNPIQSMGSEESTYWYNHSKSNIWWKFLFIAHPKYQDFFPYPPHEDLGIEEDYYEWREYCDDLWGPDRLYYLS